MNNLFFEDAIQIALDRFEEGCDQVPPVFIAKKKMGKPILMTAIFENQKQKEMTLNAARVLFTSLEVSEYCFITEGWFQNEDQEKRDKDGSMEGQPGTREGLCVIWVKREENQTLSKKIKMFEIVKKDKKRELAEKPEFSNAAECSGTFTECLLSKRPTASIVKEAQVILRNFPSGLWKEV